jgi:Ricin-type beta-trefoil lectin domain
VRFGRHLTVAAVLLLSAPAALAAPVTATPTRPNTPPAGTQAAVGARPFKPGDLAPPPARPERDKAVAERVARGKAVFESMTPQERQNALKDVQSKVTPEVQAAAAARAGTPPQPSTLDQLSLSDLAALTGGTGGTGGTGATGGTDPALARRLAEQNVSVTTATGQGARHEEVHTARNELRAQASAAGGTGDAVALGVDDDFDGLPASFEATIADLFTPGYIPSITEAPGTGRADFRDQVPQTELQVYDSIPPRQHYRVKPLGFTNSGGQQYSWLRLDYLTLWNRDDGLAALLSGGCLGHDLLDMLVGVVGLRRLLSQYLFAHPIDNERSIILAYAPTSGSQINLNPAAYTARILYTAAHEEGPLDNSYLVLINDPPNHHRLVTETLQKHATYPFYPINGYPLLPTWALAAMYAFIDTLAWFGLIGPYLADYLFYLVDVAYYGCIVERHYDIGYFWWPATAVNVGEPGRPAPGYRFIDDAKLARKFVYPFFTTSQPPPEQRIATVAVNSSAYFVGQAPTYTVTGTPNSPIYWSSTKNGVSTGESDAFYGHYTDGNGNWSGGAAAWTAGDVGFWTRSVRIGTQSGTASFTVYQTQPAFYSLTAVHSGRCLDVSGVSQDNGANVWQWDCHGGNNQQWLLTEVSPGVYTMAAVHSGKCIDVSGASPDIGAVVWQWTCHGGTNQQWRLTQVSSGVYTLAAVHSGRCLDVSGVSLDNGAVVWQWDCHGGTNQQWRVSVSG